MGEIIHTRAYFASTEEAESVVSAGADYVAGLRGGTEEVSCEVHFRLSAEEIETVVLARAQLLLELDPNGRVYIQPMGLSDEAIDVATKAGHLPSTNLCSLVEASLTPENLHVEDTPLDALKSLRGQLVDALAIVDSAMSRLNKS